jgi:hypothetical protein
MRRINQRQVLLMSKIPDLLHEGLIWIDELIDLFGERPNDQTIGHPVGQDMMRF